MEEWKPVTIGGVLYPYEVSESGSVRRKGGASVKSHTHGPGYRRLGLYLNDRRVRCYVHRLVAEAFVPNPRGVPFVNHKNGIKSDNRAGNLEWCTHQENADHAGAHGLRAVGNMFPNSKLNPERVQMIRQLRKFGGLTYKEIAAAFGVHLSIIHDVVTGKTWKHVAA